MRTLASFALVALLAFPLSGCGALGMFGGAPDLTAIEVAGIAVLFVIFGWGMDLVGVTAAFLAFLGGRLMGVLYLMRSSSEVVRSAKVRA